MSTPDQPPAWARRPAPSPEALAAVVDEIRALLLEREASPAEREALAALDRELAAAAEWLRAQPEVVAAEVAPATVEEHADCGPCRRLTARLAAGEVASTLIWPGLTASEAVRHLLAVHRGEVRALREMGPARN